MKKILRLSVILFVLVMGITACGKDEEKKEANKLDLSVEKIVDRVYDNIPDDDMPALITMEILDDNIEYYLGTKDIDYKKAIASEPLMSSNAWSVVIVELNDGADVEKTKKAIKDNVNPAKWICVDAEKVIVENRGNIIILIMMDEGNANIADKVLENFKNL